MNKKTAATNNAIVADVGQVSLGFARERIEGCIAALTPDSDVWSIAHVAAAGSMDAARLLVAGNCNLNATNKAGWTLLHMAAKRGDLELISLLLDSSAAVDPFDSEGRTPLDRAAIAGHADAVTCLITAGADYMEQSEQGQRAVDWATGDAKVVLARYTLDALAKQARTGKKTAKDRIGDL
ncbi:ankyrin repeat domain-containing protein [Pseudoxanthomonas daejeonensis]|uniref:Ankyrin repeat domain-containing protein n=1 Tax=Pseudoxanthomonas daejeonensis TaxID=266062 RepID=A0ABQ6Z925_9GAMM|nr:ankyrin repeat domain-containing protein [Pseudoxanthomonas daejeonensis]KAF1695979.1 hypothetical protein CSC65_05640 [Pseudoxanthomonas daejeonensis]